MEPLTDFRAQLEPHRRELQAHCYRMLGSLHDAEDLAQESLLRAWNRRQTFEGRSSLRTWLHRIATNACLDALEQRRPRSLPAELRPAAGPGEGPGAPVAEPIWLTPAPDALFDAADQQGPEARYSARESVALAFLVALQLLPPRQRAVLLLRDVMGWQAAEVAESLGLTVAAANSALQRARETIAKQREAKERAMAPDETIKSLLHRYMRAWDEADPAALIGLLHEEVTLAMPPMPAWYAGRANVEAFLGQLLAGAFGGPFRTLLTAANGQPAVATYQLDAATGSYVAQGLQLVDLRGDQIRGIISFLDPSLFPKFGLPETLGQATTRRG